MAPTSNSKAQKQAAIQFILNLMIQNGQALPPRELRRVLRDYEVGGLEHFFASTSRGQAKVTEENRRLIAGEQVGINSWDDDSLHVDEHNDFRNSARYATAISGPNGAIIAQNFEAHVQAHQDRRQKQANAQAAAQMAQTAAAQGNSPPDPGLVAAGTGAADAQPPTDAVPSPPMQPSPASGG